MARLIAKLQQLVFKHLFGSTPNLNATTDGKMANKPSLKRSRRQQAKSRKPTAYLDTVAKPSLKRSHKQQKDKGQLPPTPSRFSRRQSTANKRRKMTRPDSPVPGFSWDQDGEGDQVEDGSDVVPMTPRSTSEDDPYYDRMPEDFAGVLSERLEEWMKTTGKWDNREEKGDCEIDDDADDVGVQHGGAGKGGNVSGSVDE